MNGMTTKDEYGNTVTKYAARIDHNPELHERVHGLEHEITDAVANLGELLARLRRLPLYALDGDDVAAAKALEALGDEDDCCGMGPVVDIDTIDRLSATIDDLEELTGARTEQYTRHVPGDEIQATVQELAADPVAEGCEVTVTEAPYRGVARPLSGRIHFDRKGKYVDIWVHRTPDVAAEREALNALIRQRGLESVYEESIRRSSRPRARPPRGRSARRSRAWPRAIRRSRSSCSGWRCWRDRPPAQRPHGADDRARASHRHAGAAPALLHRPRCAGRSAVPRRLHRHGARLHHRDPAGAPARDQPRRRRAALRRPGARPDHA